MSVCEVKYGKQPDGGILLGPKSVKALADAIRWKTDFNDGLRSRMFLEKFDAFCDVAWEECRLDWEVYT